MDRRNFLKLASAKILLSSATVALTTIPTTTSRNNVEPHEYEKSRIVIHKKPIEHTDALFNERTLYVHNIHTFEVGQVVYWREGQYLSDGLEELNYLARDRVNNECIDMECALYDTIYRIKKSAGLLDKQPLDIISGYRSPATNAMLRRRSKNVAKNSLHMHGKAIDISHPDIDIRTLYKFALAEHTGGIGLYTRDNFIHIDVGKPRRWGR